jgi:hypothetical protein
MDATQAELREFKRGLASGVTPNAYRSLLSFMLGLRTRFKDAQHDAAVSGLYQGYMDMTYFAVSPPSLKERGLKIAIVFNYEAFRFEVWLAGGNRKVQRDYWELFRADRRAGWRVVAPAPGIDSIVERDLADGLELSDPDALASTIESAVSAFIGEIEGFLAEHEPRR